ncbi:MAG: ATP phosphoribosyltransferase [Lentisphaeria bacterium]|nr:ATP phosphoribosyltransferase [Lentisphaeria bacterium]MDD4455162.1 ATP phosphoribosyltransferase [Candidatus Methanomethylophilaceae archaeon]
MSVLRLALPKGSLEETTVEMFRRAGYKIDIHSRSYYPEIDDPEIECMLIRAQEIARYVELGIMDAGLTGYDWILENSADVVEIAELVYGKVGRKPLRWVLAVPNDSAIHCAKDLAGKRIATEAMGMTKRYLEKHGVEADVEFSWGATEVKPPHLADAIVEITETGSSLKANNLRIVDTICETTTRFIANKAAAADPFKRQKMDGIALLLQAVLAAENKVGLMLNVHQKNLQEVLNLLPALQQPTVSHLSNPEWLSLTTVLDSHIMRDIIPALKAAGAVGLVEYTLNKVVF